jgi:CheY-like chemotaxis protein
MHQTHKILIAEDDPHLCPYLVTLLDQKNCEIAVEHNGEDPIRRAASFQPDVALIGFVMPGIDGSTTGVGPSILKVSPRTNVTFITEFVLPETLDNLKAQGYHSKTLPAPFERAELEALCFPMADGMRQLS